MVHCLGHGNHQEGGGGCPTPRQHQAPTPRNCLPALFQASLGVGVVSVPQPDPESRWLMAVDGTIVTGVVVVADGPALCQGPLQVIPIGTPLSADGDPDTLATRTLARDGAVNLTVDCAEGPEAETPSLVRDSTGGLAWSHPAPSLPPTASSLTSACRPSRSPRPQTPVPSGESDRHPGQGWSFWRTCLEVLGGGSFPFPFPNNPMDIRETETDGSGADELVAGSRLTRSAASGRRLSDRCCSPRSPRCAAPVPSGRSPLPVVDGLVVVHVTTPISTSSGTTSIAIVGTAWPVWPNTIQETGPDENVDG